MVGYVDVGFAAEVERQDAAREGKFPDHEADVFWECAKEVERLEGGGTWRLHIDLVLIRLPCFAGFEVMTWLWRR